MKIRTSPQNNYKAFYFNGTTVRMPINNKIPIQQLNNPEFYDIKITDNCNGKCPYCYMSSLPEGKHFHNIIKKCYDFFGVMSKNERPFQVAIGGGEPTGHPDFLELLKILHELDITPNYTTNGLFIKEKKKEDTVELIKATKKYSGGVAVSCHEHLDKYWKLASNLYYDNGVKLNLHIIISDKKSIDRFLNIFQEYNDRVDHFVLLPYGVQGRAVEKTIDWKYFISVLPDDQTKLAYGANFYPYLIKDIDKFKVSIYEPESMSRFLDMNDMKLYKSSFLLEEVK